MIKIIMLQKKKNYYIGLQCFLTFFFTIANYFKMKIKYSIYFI